MYHGWIIFLLHQSKGKLLLLLKHIFVERCVTMQMRGNGGMMSRARDITKIRNIGVMAHIDAGKTTVLDAPFNIDGTVYAAASVSRDGSIRCFTPRSCTPIIAWG